MKEINVQIRPLEEAEAAKQKQKRENEELRGDLENSQGDLQKADEARKRLQGELDNVTVQMELGFCSSSSVKVSYGFVEVCESD